MKRRQIKILFVEDSPDDWFLMKRILTRAGVSFSSDLVTEKMDFIKAINENTYDIIISDFMLDQFSCLDVMEICRDINIATPIMLVSGMITEEKALSLLKKGIKGYILKDNIKELPRILDKIMSQ